MGNYNNSAREIASVIDEALDKIEGDITEENLLRALERAKLYPFVSDKKKSVPKYVKAGLELEKPKKR